MENTNLLRNRAASIILLFAIAIGTCSAIARMTLWSLGTDWIARLRCGLSLVPFGAVIVSFTIALTKTRFLAITQQQVIILASSITDAIVFAMVWKLAGGSITVAIIVWTLGTAISGLIVHYTIVHALQELGILHRDIRAFPISIVCSNQLPRGTELKSGEQSNELKQSERPGNQKHSSL